MEDAFKWDAESYPHGDCPSCQRLPARAGEDAPIDDRLCKRCYQDRILSERIVGARYIAYHKGPGPKTRSPKDTEWLRRSTLSLFEDDVGNATHHVVLLAELDDLSWLDLRECSAVSDLSPLREMIRRGGILPPIRFRIG